MEIKDFVDEKHDRIIMMFGSSDEKHRTAFKDQYKQVKCYEISGKEEVHIKTMTGEAFELVNKQIANVNSALLKACCGTAIDMALARLLGEETDYQVGVVVCIDCLDRSVMISKELVQTLEDLRDKVKHNDAE